MLFIAIVPLPLLWWPVAEVQKLYAVGGALFMPLLALTLLLMNRRSDWVGKAFRQHGIITLTLVLTIAFFAYAGVLKIEKTFQ